MQQPARHRQLAKHAALATYVVLLAGQFSLERVGLTNPFPIPERAVAASVVLLFFAHPFSVVRRSGPGTSPVPLVRPVTILLIVLLLSALWAPPSPGLGNALWDIATMLACYVVLVQALQTSRDAVVSVFMTSSLAAGVLFALVGLSSSGQGERIAAFGGGPNVYARITGMGLVAAIYFAMRERGRRQGAAVALTPLLAAATVLSGSRGAMAGLAGALFVLLFTIKRRAWRRIIVWLVTSSPLIVVVYLKYGSVLSSTIQTRIVLLTFQERYTSGRDSLLAVAWDLFAQKPLAGWGLHGFEATYGQYRGFTYPHNFVVQLAAETGLLGLTTLALVVGASVARFRTLPLREPSVAAFLAGTALFAVASQFSGDYYDSRMLWALLLITGSALPSHTRRRDLHPMTSDLGGTSRSLSSRPPSDPVTAAPRTARPQSSPPNTRAAPAE